MELCSPVVRRTAARRRPGPLAGLLAGALLTASACAAAPDASPATSGAGSPVPASPIAEPTSPLFGEPPPLDPCELLLPTEVQTVLEGPFLVTEQETSGGAASSCIFETAEREDRVAVTVRKAPTTEQEFQQGLGRFGRRMTPVTDLGAPAALVPFGPTATVYALHEDVEFYIDVVRAERTGGEIAPLALGLMERALTRLRLAASPTPGVTAGD